MKIEKATASIAVGGTSTIFLTENGKQQFYMHSVSLACKEYILTPYLQPLLFFL